MNSDWKQIYSTNNLTDLAFIQELLSNEEIEVVSIDKRDSSYLFGEIELYVSEINFEKSIRILKENNL